MCANVLLGLLTRAFLRDPDELSVCVLKRGALNACVHDGDPHHAYVRVCDLQNVHVYVHACAPPSNVSFLYHENDYNFYVLFFHYRPTSTDRVCDFHHCDHDGVHGSDYDRVRDHDHDDVLLLNGSDHLHYAEFLSKSN